MNMDIFAYLLLQIVNGYNWQPEFNSSTRFKNWIAHLDLKTCPTCRNMHGKIWGIAEQPEREPPVHPNCRCEIKSMVTVKAGTATINKTEGADWHLKYNKKLPDYYILENDLKVLGWKAGKWPSNFANGKMLKGGVYKNANYHLPQENNRIWYEADINYREGKRNSQRIVWSNDGLIFVTYDHYKTFYEIV